MSLDQLLLDHRESISQLKELLKDELAPEQDDVWLLRYILSFKTPQESVGPARFAIEWHRKHSALLQDIKQGKCKPPKMDIITQFQVLGEHKFTKEGEPVQYVRIGLCNTKGLMDTVSYEDVLLFMTIQRAKALDYCDQLTRKERRLVKVIGVLDFSGFSLIRGNDSRFQKILAETSQLAEKLFPQLLGKSVMINTPSYFSWLFNTVKPLLSKRAVEKVSFCPGFASGKSIQDCPWVSKMMRLQDIPSFLGGTCNCVGGCIGGVPNSQTTPLNEISSDGLLSITVSARSQQTIELYVSPGLHHYSARVEAHSVTWHVYFSQGTLQTEIVPSRELRAEHGLVDGIFEAKSEGFFVMTFDNSHSLLRSKTVLYRVENNPSPI